MYIFIIMDKIKHNRKNYFLGIINGVLFNFAFAITGSETILPVYMSTLTSSGIIIGLVGSMQKALWPMPQIFMAHYLEGRKYTKFVYIYTAIIRTVTMFLMGFVIYWHPPYIIPVFLFLLFLYLFSGGLSGISFLEIVGKTIAKQRLTSFWGLRQAGGGVLAILGGFYVKFILSTFDYPKNFSILFITAGFIVAIALLSWIIADEPSSENQIKIKKFRSFLKIGFSLLSKDTDFKAIFFYKIVIGIAMGPVPFYSLFAIKMLNIDASNIGFFIALQMAGLIVSNILWERISKNGVKHIMIITALSILLQPIIAVCSLFYGILPMYIVFFLIGVSVSGLRISSMTYLLHIAPDNKRPTYMGFYNTFTAPFLFYPMLNGIIINMFSFIPTFIISGIFAIIAFILVVKYISN